MRKRRIAHYALRASPDGEGDWSARIPQALVNELRPRARGDWSPAFAHAVTDAIHRRHLPLLVDAGGKISPETEQIAAACTHAIVLAANPNDAAAWRDLAARHRLILLADLHSSLTEPDSISQASQPLRGTISGLARHASPPRGLCIQSLIDHVSACLAWNANDLFHIHRTQTDYDLVLHLEQAIPPLRAHPTDVLWTPDQLAPLLASLPPSTPLALYGRAPLWLYAALAVLAAPAPCQIFDVRYGWIELPLVLLAQHPGNQALQWDAVVHAAYTQINFHLHGAYLAYHRTQGVVLPLVDPQRGVILNGKTPIWLLASSARVYSSAAWVACYQPQLHAAVVVSSATTAYPLGSLVHIVSE